MKGAARAVAQRLAALFENRQEEPISRQEIAELADEQLDPLKRIRRNGGARDYLDQKGIAVLWGTRDRYVIGEFGLGPVGPDEFISYTPKNQGELDLLWSRGHEKLQSPGFS
ncbi:MAG TPA: NaeI family type II restriction endonuclease [Sphingomonadaceae bacterium]|nr:NaeI family type II restriction endonuclease [Sphingomonadaceae bacterium]